MDLHVTTSPPAARERRAVDEVLGPPASGWEGGPRRPVDARVAVDGHRQAAGRRHLLLPALHALQDRVGWISPEALGYLCTRLDVAPADAHAVASAYALFSFEPAPPVVVHVCDDVACRTAAGGDPFHGSGPVDAAVRWQRSPCLGQCEHGSAALVVRAGERPVRQVMAPFGPAEAAALRTMADPVAERGPQHGHRPSADFLLPQRATDPGALRLLRRVGRVDPGSLDAYRAAGGYTALRRALELGPVGVIAELAAARLVGRGGAAFPTATKWEAVATDPRRPHHVVANADESEPGTFKDRVLMEGDPFAVVEALTVAALTTGSEQAHVYVRGEYVAATRRLEHAVEEARRRGLLGDDVMGSGRRVDVEVRRGAGAYVAGEETALLESIEGRRPEPRPRPPFPAQRGLFDRPTAINNVETLLSVLEVLTGGAAAFAATGTPGSTGTRLFCLSGRAARPGVYEVPLGTTLAELVALAGGVRGGRPLSAILLGGAAGGFVGPDELGLELSFEGARAAGVTLGSGAVVVLDDTADVGDLVRRIARFFREESCGQCVPCRVGTQRQVEVLDRLLAGRPVVSVTDELELLADLDAMLRDASICGLGQAASSAVTSALRHGLVEVPAAVPPDPAVPPRPAEVP